MKQELFIEGEKVSYSIQTKNVVSVLGRVYIYRKATTEDVLKIVWMGLTSQKGLSFAEFRKMHALGLVRMSRRRGQYTLGQVYWLVMGHGRILLHKHDTCLIVLVLTIVHLIVFMVPHDHV